MNETVFVQLQQGANAPHVKHRSRLWTGAGVAPVVEINPLDRALLASYDEIPYNEARRGRKPQEWDKVG